MVFTTNKPLSAWGARVLHDPDLAEVILDRVLERGRHITLRGPSYRTRHVVPDLDSDLDLETPSEPRPELPEPTNRAMSALLADERDHIMRCPSRFSRRELLQLASVTAAGFAVTRSDPAHSATPPDDVLRQLLAGNDRFVRGQPSNLRRSPADFRAVADGQHPRATIIGCADSRVPPELLFDQGVGDLFVIRVAGNVVSGAGAVVKGSIEYAIVELNAPLVMVLGHSNCGAVKAAVQHIDARDSLPGAINDLVEQIKPAVAKVKDLAGDRLDNAIQANVTIGVERLKALEPILAGSVKQGKVKVVGAIYDLRTGKVKVLA